MVLERILGPGALPMDSEFHCENCGAALPRRFRHSRMIVCPSCGSTSVLKDEAFRLAGTGGVMQDAPSLVALGVEMLAGSQRVTPIGHARFDYGRGWWDEYWCLQGRGDSRGCWLSVDEGDYALEWPVDEDLWPPERNLTLGQRVTVDMRPYTVTEAENATCIAVRGEFPEELTVGETHLYYDLSAPGAGLATYEVWEGGRGWTSGVWIDPWDVRAA